jgi:hypothetical protein
MLHTQSTGLADVSVCLPRESTSAIRTNSLAHCGHLISDSHVLRLWRQSNLIGSSKQNNARLTLNHLYRISL